MEQHTGAARARLRSEAQAPVIKDAEATFKRVLAPRERLLGPDHLSVGNTNLNFGNFYLIYLGDLLSEGAGAGALAGLGPKRLR